MSLPNMAEKAIVKGGTSTPVTNTLKATVRGIGNTYDTLGRIGNKLYNSTPSVSYFLPTPKKTEKELLEDEKNRLKWEDRMEVSNNREIEIKSGLSRGKYKNIRVDLYSTSGDYGRVSDKALEFIMKGKRPNKIVFVRKDDKERITPKNPKTLEPPVVDEQFIYDLPDSLFELKPNSDGQYQIKHYGVFGAGSEDYTLDEIRKDFHIFEKQSRGGKTKIRRNKKSRKYTKRNRK